MRVVPIPQLADNYGYLIIDEARQEAAVVDPAEARPVFAALAHEDAKLVAILNTHHHTDHTGGNLALCAARPGLRVIGSILDADRIRGITERVDHGAPVSFAGIEGETLLVSCHTSGHVAFRFGQDLFTGDTLFSGGCGKFFEGDATDMYRALYQVIGALPDETRIWCGHEYTLKNLEFALTVEPSNEALKKKRDEVAELRAEKKPTVPSTLGEERTFNPFLRVSSPELKSIVAAKKKIDPEDPIAVLGALRALKDQFP
jgi:hydroxyacylglutathione hydrolase